VGIAQPSLLATARASRKVTASDPAQRIPGIDRPSLTDPSLQLGPTRRPPSASVPEAQAGMLD
jgi:hypothetical protein